MLILLLAQLLLRQGNDCAAEFYLRQNNVCEEYSLGSDRLWTVINEEEILLEEDCGTLISVEFSTGNFVDVIDWLFLDGNTWHWVLSLPMYYILDTSLTLIKRLIEEKKIWKAHREHYYQKAVRSGMSHSKVVKLIIALQILIIATCYLVTNPYLVVFLAFLESVGLIIYFSSKYKKST